MILNERCHVCRTQKEHKFVQCLSALCQCPCVTEIYKMVKNINEDDITAEHPLFLEVSAPEVVELPNRDHAIRMFNAVRKSEWIDPKKKDKRRKNLSSTNYWGH